MGRTATASKKQGIIYNRAISEFDLQAGHLDIFSLGVTLYNLLTLRYPFAEATRDDPLYRQAIEAPAEFLTEEAYPYLMEGGDQYIHDFMSLVVKCF